MYPWSVRSHSDKITPPARRHRQAHNGMLQIGYPRRMLHHQLGLTKAGRAPGFQYSSWHPTPWLVSSHRPTRRARAYRMSRKFAELVPFLTDHLTVDLLGNRASNPRAIIVTVLYYCALILICLALYLITANLPVCSPTPGASNGRCRSRRPGPNCSLVSISQT